MKGSATLSAAAVAAIASKALPPSRRTCAPACAASGWAAATTPWTDAMRGRLPFIVFPPGMFVLPMADLNMRAAAAQGLRRGAGLSRRGAGALASRGFARRSSR